MKSKIEQHLMEQNGRGDVGLQIKKADADKGIIGNSGAAQGVFIGGGGGISRYDWHGNTGTGVSQTAFAGGATGTIAKSQEHGSTSANWVAKAQKCNGIDDLFRSAGMQVYRQPRTLGESIADKIRHHQNQAEFHASLVAKFEEQQEKFGALLDTPIGDISELLR